MSGVALIVIAKAPVAGRAKTRLCPPCTPSEAAALARAALEDTLEAVRATPAQRRVLVLEGDPGPWLGPGLDVLPQVRGGLDRRLAGAFDAVGGPALLIGMDTPQVSPELLSRSLRALDSPGCDCVLGPAPDGGWWAIGLREADPAVFSGLPMSVPETAASQRTRLRDLRLRFRELPALPDVDTIEDARAVAAGCPETRFARELRGIEERARQVVPARVPGSA